MCVSRGRCSVLRCNEIFCVDRYVVCGDYVVFHVVLVGYFVWEISCYASRCPKIVLGMKIVLSVMLLW